MSTQIHRCPDGWSAVLRCGFAHFMAPDGYVIVEGDGWGDDNGDGDTEVWYAYAPGDGERSTGGADWPAWYQFPPHDQPIGGADWPHLDDAVAAVERHRRRSRAAPPPQCLSGRRDGA